MDFSCPFGIAEKLLREKEYPSEPDREIEVDGKVMMLNGLRVYLPQFSAIVHEGIFCNRVDGRLQPEYSVTAIVDRTTGKLLYDEECDFTECVYHWQEKKFTLAQIEAQKCVVEGIEVREHENTVQATRSGRNH